jgi:hypothetical protein
LSEVTTPTIEKEEVVPEVPTDQIGASVWRLGPGGTLLSSVVEHHAADFAASDREAIYFYADLEGSSELKHDEDTMQKVYSALGDQGLSEKQIVNAVNAMQNAGVYFREANF